MNKVKKLLSTGDTVYSANGGVPMVVTAMNEETFDTEQDTFRYDEVRELFFLTKAGYYFSKQGGTHDRTKKTCR